MDFVRLFIIALFTFGGLLLVEFGINMTIIFKSFSVVFRKFNCTNVMASGGFPGKGDGQGSGGYPGKGIGQGSGKNVHWLAQDVRQTRPGLTWKPAVRPKPRKTVECRNCSDLCCSLSRELFSEAFNLRVVDMSRKVSLLLI